VYRIIDANLNRLREGLRVLEDVARFYLNNEALTGTLRELKHTISSAIKADEFKFLEGRDVGSDIGVEVSFDRGERENILSLIEANFKRAQEAARTLEENFKLLGKEGVESFKRIRFALYDLEGQMLGNIRCRFALEGNLYVIIDKGLVGEKIFDITKQVLDAGVKVLQLREKGVYDKVFLEDALRISEIAKNYGALLIINDRPDIAVACEADGVHVGQEDLPVEAVRRVVGHKIVGISTHNLEQVEEADSEDLEYIACGPVFHTTTKDAGEPVGLEFIRCFVQKSPMRQRKACWRR